VGDLLGVTKRDHVRGGCKQPENYWTGGGHIFCVEMGRAKGEIVRGLVKGGKARAEVETERGKRKIAATNRGRMRGSPGEAGQQKERHVLPECGLRNLETVLEEDVYVL